MQTATLRSADHEVIISIGSADFTTNGVIHELDVPAQIIEDRTMVPMWAVVESVGHNISWGGVVDNVSGIRTASLVLI